MNIDNVLLISYDWPPWGSVGMIRMARFAKYLIKMGKKVSVITKDETSGKVKWNANDPELGKVKVVRIPIKSNISFFDRLRQKINPQLEINWFRSVINSLSDTLKDAKYDVIISSSPPESSHLIAREIKRSLDIPWIADLRDLWSEDHYRGFGLLRRLVISFEEKSTLVFADKIVTVSYGWGELLKKRYKEKVSVVTNGFDKEWFEEKPIRSSDKFKISYLGKINARYQEIKFFFKALSNIINAGKIEIDNMDVDFYVSGYGKPDIKKKAREMGLEGVISDHRSVELIEANKIMKNSNLLLLIGWKGLSASGWRPQKVYEYIGSRVPILLINAEENIELMNVIRETESGSIANSAENIEIEIMKAYNKFIRSESNIKNKENKVLNNYEAVFITNKLCDVMNDSMVNSEKSHGIVKNILDNVAFMLLGVVISFLGLLFIVFTSFSSNKKRLLGNSEKVNRLAFRIMDLGKDVKKDYIKEDIFLNGGISEELSVFFDFDEDIDKHVSNKNNIDCYSFSIHRKGKLSSKGFIKLQALFNFIKDVSDILKIAKNKKVNCIESHEGVFLGILGAVFSRILKSPFILHMNTSYEEKFRGTGAVSFKFLHFRLIERWLENLVMAKTDVIVADRAFYRDSSAFPKGCRPKYVTTGVKAAEIYYTDLKNRKNIKKELGIEGKDFILYVGRLHNVKYVRDLIEAFKVIKDFHKEAYLGIAGKGVLEKELRDMTDKYGIKNSVMFLGLRNGKELTDLFFTADVVVQPHGGQVLLESALSGTPMVVYDFDWHREFIEDGKMGFIVPFGDIEDLAKKTLTLLNDKKLNKKMGEYSRNIAFSRYSREKSISAEKQVFSDFIRKKY